MRSSKYTDDKQFCNLLVLTMQAHTTILLRLANHILDFNPYECIDHEGIG